MQVGHVSLSGGEYMAGTAGRGNLWGWRGHGAAVLAPVLVLLTTGVCCFLLLLLHAASLCHRRMVILFVVSTVVAYWIV